MMKYHLDHSRFFSFTALGIAGAFCFASCSQTNFSSSDRRSLGLQNADAINGDGNDGDDHGNGGKGSGGSSGSGGGGEGAGGGNDSGDDTLGGSSSNGGGAEGDDTDGEDDSTGGGGKIDLDEGDGEVSLKLRHDMVVTRLQADHKMSVKVELFQGGKAVASHTESYDRKFKGERKFPNVCRTARDTCVRLTFIGDKTFSSNGNTMDKGVRCLVLNQDGKVQVKALVDSTGMGLIGSVCADSNEDLFTFTCPDAKTLKYGTCEPKS